MKFYSTNDRNYQAGFREAVIEGLPADNGLFFPDKIPQLPESFFSILPELTMAEIGTRVMLPFAGEDIPENDLASIIEETLDFEIPVAMIGERTGALELFHGPTLAFKDVGARFLARCLGYFSVSAERKVKVLVATSGDTGSAVGQGFLNVPNVEVVILYPSGKVSPLQEKQLTTLGHNIQALEIDGNFDDCQRLVKQAFLDRKLRAELVLTSANSINIARWLPQSIYYFWAYRLLGLDKQIIFSVPSGNYGNLTAGMLAKSMGLPIQHFLAASNANKIIPDYLESGIYSPAPSVSTLSNAMDVGDPSNFPRMQEIYQKEFDSLTTDVTGFSFSDSETVEAVKHVYQETGYMMDPHGAIGYLALKKYGFSSDQYGIFLETAHPAKFDQTMQSILGHDIPLPPRLAERLNQEKISIKMSPEYSEFQDFLKI